MSNIIARVGLHNNSPGKNPKIIKRVFANKNGKQNPPTSRQVFASPDQTPFKIIHEKINSKSLKTAANKKKDISEFVGVLKRFFLSQYGKSFINLFNISTSPLSHTSY